MSAESISSMTIEEYLAGERTSPAKHEFLNGQVYALAGASRNHNLIVVNLIAELHSQLKQRSCSVFPSDLRIKISATGLYTYPDVSVVCGETWFDDSHQDTLLNPTLIIEVLSPSTEHYDRGGKFQHYRQIPSLREYLLVAQDPYHIEHYSRQAANQWLLSEIDDPQAVLELRSIQCRLTVQEVYAKI
ncbi:Uma2 family endonuclease [Herpetosiphon gulosus]|uniref:Putative restriction endonuclease domain-containing protein n=1 Tax=Herpetosiphon gulosus TaxID=1973496 RepID=A0ABP9WWD4_9CHLR